MPQRWGGMQGGCRGYTGDWPHSYAYFHGSEGVSWISPETGEAIEVTYMAFSDTWIYHITGIANLASIARTGLQSDLAIGSIPHQVIGYSHIKARRMTEYRVPCCPGNPFVGNFVPFYYCPRSPMLFTINKGNTGLKPGCQRDIVHLATTIGDVIAHRPDWAISDGNAGAEHTSFASNEEALEKLDWEAIRSNSWTGKTHQKSAEFLVRDAVPWTAIRGIGCIDDAAKKRVEQALKPVTKHLPEVKIFPKWYYP